MGNSLNITFPGNLAQVDTDAELRQVPSFFVNDGYLYATLSLGAIFAFDTGSTAADDGSTVIKPNDRSPLQAGRWIKEASGFAGGPAGPVGPANSTFDTLSNLKAAPATNKSYTLAANNRQSMYTYVQGDFTGKVNDFDVVKLDSVAANVGALKRIDAPLYAAISALSMTPISAPSRTSISGSPCRHSRICARSLKRDSNYGSLRIAVGAPGVTHHGFGIFFDGCSTGTGDPGFYPALWCVGLYRVDHSGSLHRPRYGRRMGRVPAWCLTVQTASRQIPAHR